MTGPAPSVSAAVTLTASAALLPVLAVLGELRSTWVAFTAFAALCAAVGRRSRPSAAPLIGLAAWLFHNGFVEHRHGTLALAAPVSEAAHVLLLTAAALAAALLAAPRLRSVRPDLVPRPPRAPSRGDPESPGRSPRFGHPF